VVDLDATLGQQLFDVAVGQAVAEVPADRDCDHLRRKPEPGKRRPVDLGAFLGGGEVSSAERVPAATMATSAHGA
jgi:hypothetical protein